MVGDGILARADGHSSALLSSGGFFIELVACGGCIVLAFCNQHTAACLSLHSGALISLNHMWRFYLACSASADALPHITLPPTCILHRGWTSI